MAILTLDEAKTALEITTTKYDVELPEYIAAAEECVNFLCGPSEPVTITETRYGSGEIALSTCPIISVESISGQAWGPSNMSQLWINNTAGTVRARTLSYPIRDDYYEVTYTAGRESVPLSIKQGVRIILKHQWETRRGINTRNPGMGGSDDTAMLPGLGYAIPNRALQILSPYMTGPSVG